MDLKNVSNYLSVIKESDVDIIKSYNSIIVSLLNNINTNISIRKIDYFKHIISYGIECITHIYKLLLSSIYPLFTILLILLLFLNISFK